MELSVLVPVRDRTDHLANLVAGLNRAGDAPRLELLVGWMGGEDPRPALARASGFDAAALPVDGEVLPLAAARNALAKAAGGELLVFLDVDCIPSRSLLAGHAAALRDAEEAITIGETLYLPRGFVAGGADEAALRRAGRRHPERIDLFPALGGPRIDSRHDLFWSLNFGLRRGTFERIGGFDGAYRGYGIEDTDFGLRAARAGVPLCWLAGAVAFHQFHPPTRLRPEGIAALVDNARRYRKRWGEWPAKGWLDELAALGLIEWDEAADRLEPAARQSR